MMAWIDSPRGSDRVKRGGSFYSGDYALRAAVRVYADPSIRVDTLGFRCAR